MRLVQAHVDSTRPREVSSSAPDRPADASAGVPGAPAGDRGHRPSRTRSCDTNRSWLSTSSTTLPTSATVSTATPTTSRHGRRMPCEQDGPGDQQARRGHVDVARRGRLLGAELGPDEAGEEEERDARDQQCQHDRREPCAPSPMPKASASSATEPDDRQQPTRRTPRRSRRDRPARTRGRRRGWAERSATIRCRTERHQPGEIQADRESQPDERTRPRQQRDGGPSRRGTRAPTPDVASAIVNRTAATAGRRGATTTAAIPAAVAPIVAGLERPQDVVAARTEDEHDRHRAEGPHRRRLAPDDDDRRSPATIDVQRERDPQVRPVRHGPDRPDQRPVEDRPASRSGARCAARRSPAATGRGGAGTRTRRGRRSCRDRARRGSPAPRG